MSTKQLYRFLFAQRIGVVFVFVFSSFEIVFHPFVLSARKHALLKRKKSPTSRSFNSLSPEMCRTSLISFPMHIMILPINSPRNVEVVVVFPGYPKAKSRKKTSSLFQVPLTLSLLRKNKHAIRGIKKEKTS